MNLRSLGLAKMIRVILFDLGGVLVELVGSPFPESNMKLKEWFESLTVKGFERGQISAKEFIKQVKQDLKISASDEEIVKTFQAWPRHLYPGVDELLETLSQKYTLAVLSNTNELHEQVLLNNFGLKQKIKSLFFFHRLGCAKPEIEPFQRVLDKLEVAPESVLFFDDNAENVNTAKKLGINAHQTLGISEVHSVLLKLGL